MAWGASAGFSEAQLTVMVEKVHAATEAMTPPMLGGSPVAVIERDREHVAATIVHLSAG